MLWFSQRISQSVKSKLFSLLFFSIYLFPLTRSMIIIHWVLYVMFWNFKVNIVSVCEILEKGRGKHLGVLAWISSDCWKWKSETLLIPRNSSSLKSPIFLGKQRKLCFLFFIWYLSLVTFAIINLLAYLAYWLEGSVGSHELIWWW